MLLPELLVVIFDVARSFSVIERAHIRCVCRYLRDADAAFVSPLWTSALPNVKALRRGRGEAWALFRYLCIDAATRGVWHALPAPLSVRWVLARNFGTIRENGMAKCLRLEWPTHTESGERRFSHIIRIYPALRNERIYYVFAEYDPDVLRENRRRDFVMGGSDSLLTALPLPYANNPYW